MSIKEVVIFLNKLIRFHQYFISIFVAMKGYLILLVGSLFKLTQSNKIFVHEILAL